MDNRIARVFIRKTQYTPTDDLVFFTRPGLLVPEVDLVHVSCLFSWDKPRAEVLARQWERVAPVKLGGPAYATNGNGAGEFVPGLHIRKEYTITSRGCCRKCPFCLVHDQEGDIKELKSIHKAPWIQDNNLLACSREHVEKVFMMLMEFKNVRFLGGLDIRLIREWHIDWLSKMKIKVLAIAFDMPNVEEHLKRSLKLLHQGGISHGVIYCFVLGGFFEWDTPEKAENRCRLVLKNGATPFGMYYKGPGASVRKKPVEWGKWASRWAYMPGIYAMAKREKLETYQDTLK